MIPRSLLRARFINPLKYVDPSGEVVVLTGSEEERQRALQRIKDLLGEERFKQLTVTEGCYKGLGDVTILKYDSVGTSFGMERVAATEDDKVFGWHMGELFESKMVVAFKIATHSTDKDGNTKALDTIGGGHTIGGGLSKSGYIEVYVHPNAGAIADQTINARVASGEKMSSEGRSLYYTNAITDAHELGHARALVARRDGDSDYRSLHLENLRRKQYKGVNHNERIKH